MMFDLATRPKFENDVFLDRNRSPINVRRLVAPLSQRVRCRRDQRRRPADGLHIPNRAIGSYLGTQMHGAAWRVSQTLLRKYRINCGDSVADMYTLKLVRGFRSRLCWHEQKLTRSNHHRGGL